MSLKLSPLSGTCMILLLSSFTSLTLLSLHYFTLYSAPCQHHAHLVQAPGQCSPFGPSTTFFSLLNILNHNNLGCTHPCIPRHGHRCPGLHSWTSLSLQHVFFSLFCCGLRNQRCHCHLSESLCSLAFFSDHSLPPVPPFLHIIPTVNTSYPVSTGIVHSWTTL